MPVTPGKIFDILWKIDQKEALALFWKLRDNTHLLEEIKECLKDGSLPNLAKYLGISPDASQWEFIQWYEAKKKSLEKYYGEILSQIPLESMKYFIPDFSSLVMDFEDGNNCDTVSFKAHLTFRIPESLVPWTESQYQLTIGAEWYMRTHVFTDKWIDCVFHDMNELWLEEWMEMLQKCSKEIFEKIAGEWYESKIREWIRNYEQELIKKSLRKPFISWLRSTTSLVSIEEYHNPVSQKVSHILW